MDSSASAVGPLVSDCVSLLAAAALALGSSIRLASETQPIPVSGRHFPVRLRGVCSTLASSSPKPVIVMVDLFAHTADMTLACVTESFKQSVGGVHLYYFGFHTTDVEVGGGG